MVVLTLLINYFCRSYYIPIVSLSVAVTYLWFLLF
jgi:hypothetical protein